MLWPAIGYQSQNLWPFKFSWSIRVQFWDSRYILGVNLAFDSKVMEAWICEEILRSISRVSICYGPQSNIRVKTYHNLNLPKLLCRISSVTVYVGSQSNIDVKIYSGLNMLHLSCPISSVSIFKLKVMAVWFFLELLSFISNVSICYGPQSATRVKIYCSLDFAVDSVFNFERLDILWTAIRNQVRSHGHLNLLRASMFNFGRLDILWDSNRHPSQTLC